MKKHNEILKKIRGYRKGQPCFRRLNWPPDAPNEYKWLNLGAGDEVISGYINCDKIKAKSIHILLDLDYPLPFKDNSIDSVLLISVIAHVNHPSELKEEIARILKPGGDVAIGSCTCSCKHKYNIGGEYEKPGRKPPELTEEEAAEEAAAIKELTVPPVIKRSRNSVGSATAESRTERSDKSLDD